jgi:hypothetical protein
LKRKKEDDEKKKKEEAKKQSPYNTGIVFDVSDEEEVEVILLDDDDVVIPHLTGSYLDLEESEVAVAGPSGATAIVTTHQICYPPGARGSKSSDSSDSIAIVDSDSEDSNGPNEVQFNLNVPALRPYPGTDRSNLRPRMPITPYWRAPIWGSSSSSVTNTCVMDSFIAHVIYLSRRFPLYFRFHLNAARNEPEEFIYWLSQNTERGTLFQFSELVHKGWVQALPAGFFPTINNVVNMASSNGEAVFGHLRNSNRLWLLHQCGCDVLSREDIRQDRPSWTPQQVQALNSPSADVALNPRKASKKCGTCKSKFRYVRGLVSQATWFHRFAVARGSDRTGFPQTLEMQEIGTNAIIHFDLGYYDYVTRRTMAGTGIGHHVSIHVIPDQGTLFYNGMSNLGQLQPIPANLDQDFVLESVIYFKRFEQDRPRK